MSNPPTKRKGSKIDRILRRTRSEDVESEVVPSYSNESAIAEELERVGLQFNQVGQTKVWINLKQLLEF